ncbi:MAG: hypothetical protein KC800_32065, partial [Candidatus Eremiobacteraeota bacterium]|nr:hypothetical protein [Candidatus Eremiobacteraeota bacterium]
LTESATVSWDWLRRLLRFPYESWLPRTGIRLAAYGVMLMLVLQTVIIRYVVPLYTGLEATSEQGLEGLSSWPAWSPPLELVQWWALGVFLLGAWTAGAPGLLVDLWGNAQLIKKDVMTLGAGLLLIGPAMFLPLLAELQLGRYLCACALWAGVCAFFTFGLILFKTQRSLPKLAMDFAILSLFLGLLEMAARKALELDGPMVLGSLIDTSVGHFGFAGIVSGMALAGAALMLGLLGLASLSRSYRSPGGAVVGVVALVLAAVCAAKMPLWSADRQVPVAKSTSQVAYILGSARSNPWVLSKESYPGLATSEEVDTPEEARAALLAAYLKWDEARFLNILSDWADRAPGVTWGMVSFVDTLGVRNGTTLTVPTEARRKLVSHLLQKLEWRRLNDVVLSEPGGGVEGTLIGLDGAPATNVPLRLIKVAEDGSIEEVVQRFTEEQDWARQLLSQNSLSPGETFPRRISVATDGSGGFRFSRLPAGRYFVAVLLDQDLNLILNASIPGAIDLAEGERLELGRIRLSVGTEGEDVSLASDRWRPEGKVSFSTNSEIDSAKLEPKAVMAGFVDTKIFAGGRARVKLVSQGPGAIEARFYSKDGVLKERFQSELSGSGFDELDVDTGGQEGYLQLVITAKSRQ